MITKALATSLFTVQPISNLNSITLVHIRSISIRMTWHFIKPQALSLLTAVVRGGGGVGGAESF